MKDAFPELTYSNQTAYVKIEKPNFRGKDMRTLINKAGYGSWRMGNSFMQRNLTLRHLLTVNILSESTAI